MALLVLVRIWELFVGSLEILEEEVAGVEGEVAVELVAKRRVAQQVFVQRQLTELTSQQKTMGRVSVAVVEALMREVRARREQQQFFGAVEKFVATGAGEQSVKLAQALVFANQLAGF